MFTTLAFVTALSLAPAQAQLALTNDQVTYGYLGAARPDTKFLPGDIFFLTFDIENVKVNDNGEVLYSMGMEVRDSNGKQVFAQKPQDKKAVNTLGGTRLPAFAHVFCGSDQLPGEYTVRVAVTDRVSKQEKTIERKFEVLKPDFGLVQVGLSIDSDMQMPAPAVGVAGQFVYVNFAAGTGLPSWTSILAISSRGMLSPRSSATANPSRKTFAASSRRSSWIRQPPSNW